MALETEDGHVGLVELEELEAIEIDEALLRELLEADIEESSVQKNDMDKKQQDQNQQHEGCNNNIIDQFEWMSNNKDNDMMMEMEMEPITSQGITNNYWYPDDMVGMMVDFGFNDNAQFGCEGLICYESMLFSWAKIAGILITTLLEF